MFRLFPVVLMLGPLMSSPGFAGTSLPDTTRAHQYYMEGIDSYEAGDLEGSIGLFKEAGTRFGKKRFWKRAIECRLHEIRSRSLLIEENGLADYCRATLRLAEKKLGTMHPVSGDCQNRLGEILYYSHQNDSAALCFDHALNIYASLIPPDSLAMATVYANLSGVKMNLGQFDSAGIYLQNALDIQLNLLDSMDLKLLKTYNTYGVLEYYLGNMDQAIYYFDKTLQIRLYKYGENHHEVAASYNNLGSAYEKKKEFRTAVDLHRKALGIRRTVLDSLNSNIALSLNNLGNALFGLGEYEESNACHLEALRIRKKIFGENHRDIAMSYANIGNNLIFQDNPAKATYYFSKVVPIMIHLYGADHPLTSDAYENLGLPFYYSGRYDSAFYYLFKALRIRETVQDGINLGVARSYNNIGALYKENQDYELAMSYYRRSAEVYQTMLGEDCNYLAGSYNNMGEIYLETGDYERSLDYFTRSLDIDRANLGPENPLLAGRYLNLGAVAGEMGNPEESIFYNRKALQLHSSAYGEQNKRAASIYSNMAMDFAEMNHLDSALEYQNHAIEILEKFYGEPHFDLASHYTTVGELHMRTGLYEQASEDLNRALAVNYHGKLDTDRLELLDINQIIDKNQFIESLVAITEYNEMVLSGGIRQELLSRNLIIYRLIADISAKLRDNYQLERSKLLALKKWDYLYTDAFETAASLFEITQAGKDFHQAFRFAGLKKATALSDAIVMSQAMEHAGIPDSLIQLERSLQSRLEGQRQHLMEMVQAGREGEEKLALESEINTVTIRLNELYLAMEKNYPGYKNLRTHSPLAEPKEIMSLLDHGTLLLDFIISDSSLYTMVIRRDGQWLKKTEIPVDFEEKVNHLLSSVKKYRAGDYLSAAKEMYALVLDPLEEYFTGMDKIVVIPDGCLLLLPLDILIRDHLHTEADDLSSQDYFIKRFETVTHYSTDLWIRSLRKSLQAGPADSISSAFLGFAPVFDNSSVSDSSALTQEEMPPMDSTFAHRAVVDRLSLQKLPFSEQEVKHLVSLFTRSGIKAEGEFRTHATEEAFRAKSGDFAYLHIATHGLVNPEKPELSGLVFWKDRWDKEISDPQLFIASKENDGVLYTKEIYNLDLPARLVVLSACETGAGKMAKGEGLLSFVRGFTYAGVPNMIISYWKVNDKTTVDLMLDFYTGVLEGDSYSTALRKAKLSAIGKPSTSFPAIWGNFVLIGH